MLKSPGGNTEVTETSQLDHLKRPQLQKLAKQHGIKANLRVGQCQNF